MLKCAIKLVALESYNLNIIKVSRKNTTYISCREAFENINFVKQNSERDKDPYILTLWKQSAFLKTMKHLPIKVITKFPNTEQSSQGNTEQSSQGNTEQSSKGNTKQSSKGNTEQSSKRNTE